jgi:hypothetical protein
MSLDDAMRKAGSCGSTQEVCRKLSRDSGTAMRVKYMQRLGSVRKTISSQFSTLSRR